MVILMRIGDEEIVGVSIVLIVIAIGVALWLAGQAYFIHQQQYKNMMSLLQVTYHWCMLAHTDDGHYSVCSDQLETGLKSMYQGWGDCYKVAFYNNWLVEKIRWGL
jgi:hypothetical protein